MKQITKTFNIYKFNELSDVAKKKVKEWYLNNQEEYIFTDMCEEDLACLFGKTNLKIQYDLGYCQGDGFNIYGSINVGSIFNCLENHNGGTQLEEFENILNDKEKRTIFVYASECGEIELPCNHLYAYSLVDRIDIVGKWLDELEYCGYKNINKSVLEKFERMVKDLFQKLCDSYEKQGYEYFYEISYEDLEQYCNDNDYEFYENGEIY